MSPGVRETRQVEHHLGVGRPRSSRHLNADSPGGLSDPRQKAVPLVRPERHAQRDAKMSLAMYVPDATCSGSTTVLAVLHVPDLSRWIEGDGHQGIPHLNLGVRVLPHGMVMGRNGGRSGFALACRIPAEPNQWCPPQV